MKTKEQKGVFSSISNNEEKILDLTNFDVDSSKQSVYEDAKGQSEYTGDENNEILRINRQNQYLNKIVAPYLDVVFSNYKTPLILDIGCADGSNILLRLKGRHYYSLLGVDKNQEKIDQANTLYKSERDSFVCCDINTDFLYSVLSSFLREKDRLGFDIIHISSVLLHIEKPNILLNNLHAFLSEDGCVFIQDEDDGVNLIYPSEDSFEDCFYIWDHSFEAGDRRMGRKIPFFLQNSGYSDIKILSSHITSVDFNGEMKDCLWDMYFNSDLWVANDVSYYDNIEAFERFIKYKKKHTRLKELYMKDHFFIMLGFFFITAKK